MQDNLLHLEPIFFFHACKTRTVGVLRPEFFKNKYIRPLLKITKKFYERYKELPFNLDTSTPSLKQLENIVRKNPNIAIIDDKKSEKENIDIFLKQAEILLTVNYDSYNQKFLSSNYKVWAEWQHFTHANQQAIDYIQSQEINETNYAQVIHKAKSLIAGGGSVFLDETLGYDFYDPKAHIQIPPDKLFNTGFNNLNKWFTDSDHTGMGGVEPGTLTILLGPPNIGKSIFTGSLAKNFHLNGVNTLLVSLEMSVQKLYKRIGASVMGVNLKEYGKYALTDQFEGRLREIREESMRNFHPVGLLRAERFASISPAGIRSFKRRVEDQTGQQIHAVLIDYFTELGSSQGNTRANAFEVYEYHKQNANELFELAVEESCSVITPHQINPKSQKVNDDIELEWLSESSAITFRPDYIFGIIQSPEMYVHKKYFLKNLKARESSYKHHKIEFDIDYSTMSLTESGVVVTPNDQYI